MNNADARTMLNKVPLVTLFFWVIKIMATTVGETAADFLSVDLKLGLGNTSLLVGALLVITLVMQFSARKYVPSVYWLVVVLISIFGTLVTDNLVDIYGVSLETTTILFSIALVITFVAWYVSEKHSRYTPSSPPGVRASTGLRSCSLLRSARQQAIWSRKA